jgi:hypothetical protein
MAGKRRSDVSRKDQRAGRRRFVEYAASADARFLRVRILRKIPIRIQHLQKVMKDVAGYHGAVTADLEPEKEMPG